jgi:putative acetyltransferase
VTPGLDLVLTGAPNAEARSLVAELDSLLAEGYPPEQQHGLTLDEIFAPHVRFYVATLNGDPAGCGAVALNGGWAEVKRMYTRPAVQGRGVARAVLDRLEADARGAGAQWLRLETGDVLTAAMALYRRAGFRPCGAFGPYLHKPTDTVARSRFFEKRL